MRILLFTLFLLLYSSLLTGCFHLKPSEQKTRLHLLDQSAIVEWVAADGVEQPIFGARVQRVDLPEYLLDARIFYRSADGTPVYVDTDRWAEPLRDGIARYLGTLLTQAEYAEREDNLRLRFHSFEAVRGSGVWVDVNAEIDGVSQRIRFRHGAGQYPNVEAMVAEKAAALDALLNFLAW